MCSFGINESICRIVDRYSRMLQKLALTRRLPAGAAFGSGGAVRINKSVKSGGYTFTPGGIVSGAGRNCVVRRCAVPRPPVPRPGRSGKVLVHAAALIYKTGAPMVEASVFCIGTGGFFKNCAILWLLQERRGILWRIQNIHGRR